MAPGSDRPPRLTYEDFDVEIGSVGENRYLVVLRRSPAGEARVAAELPWTEAQLAQYLPYVRTALGGGQYLDRNITSEPVAPAIRALGQQLFDALFVGRIRTLYRLSQVKVREAGSGLRIRVLSLAPEWAALPWELLWDSEDECFVCLSDIPVVRYMELPRPVEPLTVTAPLRILGMAAQPRDLEPLKVEREKQLIEDALGRLPGQQVVIEWLPGQSWDDLQDAMQRQECHIFHFVGHGAFDTEKQIGRLALSKRSGKAHWLDAEGLSQLLVTPSWSPRLVVLNACDGARGNDEAPFASVAATLVRRGIPAVLAMQNPIADDAAVGFARAFYRALANGIPVEGAVAEARTAVNVSGNETLEWATPVLYLRAENGHLFDIHPAVVEPPIMEPTVQQPEPGIERPKPEPEPPSEPRLRSSTPDRPARPQPSGTSAVDRARLLIGRGQEHHRRRDFGEAIRCFTRAIRLQPDQAEYYFARGRSHYNTGDLEHAVSDLAHAVELDPAGPAAHYFALGTVYARIEAYDQAIAAYTRAVEQNPQNADHYIERGRVYRWRGDRASAEQDYRRALQLDPENADRFWNNTILEL